MSARKKEDGEASLKERAEILQLEQKLDDLELDIATKNSEIATWRRRYKQLATQLDELRLRAANYDEAMATVLEPPKWAKPKASNKGNTATVGLLLSDLHYQETVRPEQINGHNAYNSDIGEMRIKRAFEHGLVVADQYGWGAKMDGAVIAINGDILTGIIHTELRETNDKLMFPALRDVAQILIAGINLWADVYENVLVVNEWGNHGRMTEKPKAKNAAGENFDWMIGEMIRLHFLGDPRVDVITTESADLIFSIYDTKFLLTHGHLGVGRSAGHGIGGIWPPIMRMLAKRQQSHAAMGNNWDVALLGHWHQYTPKAVGRQGFIINGSSKGADEWSMSMGFMPEDPIQALWVTTPDRGVTDVKAIFCGDRKAEGW